MATQTLHGFEVIALVFSDTISIFDSVETNEDVKILQYIIKGVYLERSFGSSIVIDGERKNYNATLFIPSSFKSDDSYVKPKEWGRMSLDDKLHNFTLRQNQIIVPIDNFRSYNTLDEILNYEDDAFRVIGVDYLDKVLPHFEVMCK